MTVLDRRLFCARPEHSVNMPADRHMNISLRRLREGVTKRVASLAWHMMSRRLDGTRVYASKSDCDVEFHTMLGRREVVQYIIGLKSVLRFCAHLKVGVVVHSDGTLKGSQIERLHHHFPRLRIINDVEARVRCEGLYGTDSFAFRQREVYLSWRRLVDTQMFRQAGRLVNIDSDVLCINEPRELLSWMENGTGPILIGQTNGEATPDKLDGLSWYRCDADEVRLGTLPVQTRFLRSIADISKELCRPARFLDGGCAGLHGHQLELDLAAVENVVKSAMRLGLPLSEWGAEQCVVVYMLSTSGGKRLDPTKNFNFFPDRFHDVPDADVIHFVGLSRYYRFVYPRWASKVLNQLTSK